MEKETINIRNICNLRFVVYHISSIIIFIFPFYLYFYYSLNNLRKYIGIIIEVDKLQLMTSLRTWISFSLFFRLHNACKNCMSYYCVFFSTPLLILDRERVTVPNPMRPKSQKAPPKNHSKVTRDHCCCSVSIPACTVSIPATITNLYLYLIICRSDSGLLSAELPLSLHVMVDKTSL